MGISATGDLTEAARAAMFEAVKPPPKGHAFCVVCLHPEREAIERKHSASLYAHAHALALDAKREERKSLPE